MGIRLYPMTTDASKLEILMGVPAGTHDRLMKIKAKFKPPKEATFAQQQQLIEQQWITINTDDNLATLDAFLTYGWGKFQVPPELKQKCNDDSGSLTGEDAIELLWHNQVTRPSSPCSISYLTLDDIGGGVVWH